MKIVIEENIPLAPLTTFKVGGPARWFAAPADAGQLREALEFARNRAVPCFVLGGGSNLLVHDDGFAGLVIHTGKLDSIRFHGTTVHCGCGCRVVELTNRAAEAGLGGLEFAGGLPGSVGGAVFMNARAYGGSFEDLVLQVSAVDKNGDPCTYTNDEMQFSYKHSLLMENGSIAFEAVLQLTPGDPDEIRNRTMEHLHKRADMGQFRHPNAGCIFKNNRTIGTPTGKLIDELGLLGLTVGEAQVFPAHGNFIINRGNASASDIARLINLVKEEVCKRTGHTLEEEVRYLGFPDPRI